LALEEQSPAEWADAVAFDAAIRHGSARANADGHPLRGTLHICNRQRVPLDEVVLRQQPADPDAPGCGPWTCTAGPVGGSGDNHGSHTVTIIPDDGVGA
jgi:hypothetical protein